MSSGLAAPIPQIPRPSHDLYDPDSWPARQLETALARLQSVQAVLKSIAYDMSKDTASSTVPQPKRTAGTYPRPLSVTGGEIATYEAAISTVDTDLADAGALEDVTAAIGKIRLALSL